MAVTHPISISLKDKANTISTTGLWGTLAQIKEYADTPGAGDVFDWFAAVANLSLSNVTRQAAATEEFNDVPIPTDDNAYNSSKLTVFWAAPTTEEKGHFSIPARDAGGFNTYPGTKDVILTVALGGTAAIEALVAATEVLKSQSGAAIVVRQIVIAGAKQSGS